jgi:hypothetical protein
MEERNVKEKAFGVDRGFGDTKYFTLDKQGKFPSTITRISKEEAEEIIRNNADDGEVIVAYYKKEYFLIGKKVPLLFPDQGKRNLQRTRQNNQKEKILFLTAVGLGFVEEEISDLVICSGLPTDDLKHKESYEKEIYNNGEPDYITIYVKGKKHKKNIQVQNVTVQNQPKGTVIRLINERRSQGIGWDVLKDKKVGICDIGYNTTDISIYVGKDLMSTETTNFSTKAMHSIVLDFKEALFKKHNIEKDEEEVINALKTGKVISRGETIDISGLVEDVFLKSADDIVSEILSNWQSKIDSLEEIVITGGVLENSLFSSLLQELFHKKANWLVNISKDPAFSNVHGFYLIAQSMIKARNKK